MRLEYDDDDQVFDSQSVRNASTQRNTGRNVGVSWFNYYFLTCLSSEDAVNDHSYSVILEEAGYRSKREADEVQSQLKFPECELGTKWVMVESLRRRGPLLSGTTLIGEPKTSSITSQLTDEFKATEISLYLKILINFPVRNMSVFLTS